MKNPWIARHKKKQTSFTFELVGAFGPIECLIASNNWLYGADIRSTDPKFLKWCNNYRFNPVNKWTGLDGFIEVQHKGKPVESWCLFDVSILSCGIQAGSHS